MQADSNRSVVSIPFRVAGGFLLLMMLWGFVSEENSIASPIKYEYEHTRKDVDPSLDTGTGHDHGSFAPWKATEKAREMHLDTDIVRVGDRVELLGLANRQDLNGVTGRVMAFDGKHYTVRLRKGIGRFKLKPDNVRMYASLRTAAGAAAAFSVNATGGGNASAAASGPGGPLHVPRLDAGHGKHSGHGGGGASVGASSAGWQSLFVSVGLLLLGCALATLSSRPAVNNKKLSIKCGQPTTKAIGARAARHMYGGGGARAAADASGAGLPDSDDEEAGSRSRSSAGGSGNTSDDPGALLGSATSDAAARSFELLLEEGQAEDAAQAPSKESSGDSGESRRDTGDKGPADVSPAALLGAI
jgi:hypothetical protein